MGLVDSAYLIKVAAVPCGRMRRVAGVVVIGLLVAGCAGGGGSTARSIHTSADATYLQMISHNDALAAEQHSTLIDLGHEACDLLDEFHGNTARVDAFFVKTAGKGGAQFFNASVMDALRGAATTAYCPGAIPPA